MAEGPDRRGKSCVVCGRPVAGLDEARLVGGQWFCSPSHLLAAEGRTKRRRPSRGWLGTALVIGAVVALASFIRHPNTTGPCERRASSPAVAGRGRGARDEGSLRRKAHARRTSGRREIHVRRIRPDGLCRCELVLRRTRRRPRRSSLRGESVHLRDRRSKLPRSGRSGCAPKMRQWARR